MNLNPYNWDDLKIKDDNFENITFNQQPNNIYDFQLLNENADYNDYGENQQIVESFQNNNKDEDYENEFDYVYENFNSNILDIVKAEQYDNSDSSDDDSESSDDDSESSDDESIEAFRKRGRGRGRKKGRRKSKFQRNNKKRKRIFNKSKKTFNKSKKKLEKKKKLRTLIALPKNDVDCPIKYGDKIILAYSRVNSDTQNCGLFGCRVANTMGNGSKSKRYLYFDHGGLKPISFFLRPPLDSTKKDGDYIQFGDGVVLAYSSDKGNTSNCGMYGCRVATTSVKNGRKDPVKFNHGKNNPTVFYVLPMKTSKEKSGDLIHYNDEVLLSLSNQLDTKNCGYGGCRVLQMYSNRIAYVNHGSNVKNGFFLRKVIGQTCTLDKELINDKGSFKINKIIIRCNSEFELVINRQSFKSNDPSKATIIEGKDIERNYSYGNILALKCSCNVAGEGGLIVYVELENGSKVFSNKEWDASADVNNPQQFLYNPANYNYESSWVKANVVDKNDSETNPFGFDYEFSPQNKWIWLEQNKTVYFKRTLGIPGDILKCSTNLTDNQAICYANRYPDLKKEFGNNLSSLKKHWKNVGCIENSSYDCIDAPLNIGNYTKKGCFNDSTEQRALPNYRGTVVDGNACAQLAENNKEMVFGLQYDKEDGNQCWTGSDLDKAISLGTSTVSCSPMGKILGNQTYYRNMPFTPVNTKLTKGDFRASDIETFENIEHFENNTIKSSMSNYYYLLIILLILALIVLFFYCKM